MLNDLIFSSNFLLNQATPKLRITDLEDYLAQGVEAGDTVIVRLRVLDPAGATLYEHAQYNDAVPTLGDILPLSGTTYKDITLPVDVDNKVDQGNYTIYAKVYIDKVTPGVPDGTYTKDRTFNFCVSEPTVSITHTVDCVYGKFTSTDATSYTQSSALETTVTRVHTIYKPASLDLAPVVSADAVVEISPLYTKDWTTKIVSTVVYEFSDYFYVTLEATGTKLTIVSCEKSLCDVICQIMSLEDRYTDELASNPCEAEKTGKRLNLVMRYYALIKYSIECGESEEVDALLAKIYRVGQFKPCACESDEATEIAGCGSSAAVINVTAGAGITVTQDEDTFNVKIEPTLKNKLDSLKVLSFGTNTPGTVTLTPTTVGETTTLKIDVSNIGSGSIITSSLVDGAVTTPKLADGAVTTIKIADANVTNGKLADNAVTEAKIGNGEVSANKIAAGAVSETKLADGAVVEAKIGALAVTAAKIAADAVTTAKIPDSAVTSAKINDGAIVEAKLGAGAVTNTKIADNAVSALKLADNSVIAGKIADGSIATAKYAAGSVTDTVLSNNAVVEAKIANGAVTVNKIGANAVTDTKINAAAVTTTKIADGNVTTAKMSGDMKTEILVMEFSFESAETGNFDFYFPFAVTLVNVRAIVTKAIAGTDNGAITFATSVGAMDAPGIQFPASSVVGYQPALYTSGTNNTIAAGSYIRVIPAKTTPGGKVKLTFNVLRT